MKVHLDLAYFNFANGGRAPSRFEGDVLTPAYHDGLVRVAGDGGRWPHILIMGEGERYDRSGGAEAWNAAGSLRHAGSPPYVPLLGCTIFDGTAFAPVIFIDPRAVVVRRWYDCRLPDHAGRNDNVLLLHASESDLDGIGWIRIITGHGDIHSGDRRLLEAQTHDRHAHAMVPTIMAMDWNCTLSGPQWEPTDYDDPEKYNPSQLIHRAQWQHGPGQAGPHRADTRALDYLCGYWTPDDRCDPTGPGQRIGGCGW